MIIKKHVFIYIFLFAALLSSSSARDFPLRLWKNYHLNQPLLFISQSNSASFVAFHERFQKEWIADYRFAEETIYMKFNKNDKQLEIVGSGDNLHVKGLKEGEVLSLSFAETSNYEIIIRKDGMVADKFVSFASDVVVAGFDELVYRLKGSDFGSNFQKQKEKALLQCDKKLNQLFSFYKINDTYSSFGKSMLSKTFSQLCTQQHNQLTFIGICYNTHEGKRHAPYYKIDIRYSALIIDKLFPVYPKTALFLFEELVGRLQDQIFYSDVAFVEIPEHVSSIRGFVVALKGGNYTETQLAARVKQLLNGLMNQMLLSEVNSLEEEINYRQNKKMHPTLIKMVSLKWQSLSRKNALSSIYEQSFTPDYFYNHANQHLDSCASKVAWLTAATAEFVLLIKATGNQDDFDALQQSTSLFKILQQVSGSDSHAKKGRYYSINTAQGVRVYVEQVGYQSFLPYIYELSNIFPQQFLKNVTTSYGLSSLNLNHDKFSSKFEYRGNIHLYFNYKILFQSRRRLQSSKNQRALAYIQQLITKVRQKINSFWQTGKVFTSWTITGEGIREREGLSMLSLLFMGQKR